MLDKNPNMTGPRIDAFEQTPVLDDFVVALLQKMTPAQKLELSFRANKGVRNLIEIAIRDEHEEWIDLQVQAELARRMLYLCED